MNIAENIDCMKAMKNLPDKAFDLAVVDPPYFSGPERRGDRDVVVRLLLALEDLTGLTFREMFGECEGRR